MARDARAAKSTIRAIKLTRAAALRRRARRCGLHDERPASADCCRSSPRYGQPSTEKTEIWVMFDGDNIYVVGALLGLGAARASGSPTSCAATPTRCGRTITSASASTPSTIAAAASCSTPIRSAALADYSVVDEGAPNTDWNPVWDVRDRPLRRRLDHRDGDSVQVAALSPRGRPGVGHPVPPRRFAARTSGRISTPVPQSMAGPQALNRVSSAGTLVGLDLPPASRNLELKPYALGERHDRSAAHAADVERSRRRHRRRREIRHHREPDRRPHRQHRLRAGRGRRAAGQPDALQPVLPEKREFFLEGRGLFDFGAAARPAAAVRQRRLERSRRICSTAGASASIAAASIPIDVGGRLTGKVGELGVGVDEHPDRRRTRCRRRRPTNFTVVRVEARHPAPQHHRRDVHQPHRVERDAGGIEPGATASTRRSASTRTSTHRRLLRAHRDARRRSGDNESYQGKFDYGADRYGARAECLKVGEGFNPEVGFLRRTDFTRSFASARFSPRPKSMQRRAQVHASRQRSSTSRTAPATSSRASRPDRFNVELQQQRSAQRRGERATTTLPGRAVRDRRRRHDSGRRLSTTTT